MMPEHDSVFTDAELAYLHDRRRLARIATVGADGTPHVVPVGWTHNRDEDTIDVGGRDLTTTRKYRDVARTGRAAIVIDDLASTDPWRPRAIEVRGRAEALPGPQPVIRIHPKRIISWGLGGHAARAASTGPARREPSSSPHEPAGPSCVRSCCS
jgi:pyridoxamine 5'-phosphate oxidase family protein